MAKYTITIKTLIDNNFDFGLQDYPLFNESYREILNNNILNYYNYAAAFPITVLLNAST